MALIKTLSSVCRGSRVVQVAGHSRRLLHASATRLAITNLQMPAMSPTMTEGGIASWKKKEGESFAQGDVLLEIETDKATIEVEAQEDGVMGKILAPDGTKGVLVGKVIALLAEEGDDISNLETPKEEATPPPKQPESAAPPSPPQSKPAPEQSTETQAHSQTPPDHSRPLFPSVHRLLLENNVTSTEGIKGTGVRGMLTKGDVLTYLGKASNPLGTFKPSPSPIEEAAKARGKAPTQAAAPTPPPLDGPAIRRLIVSSMFEASQKAKNPYLASFKNADFDSVIADYLPPSPKSAPQPPSAAPSSSKKSAGDLDGLY
ncbi:single hybrid motif-containing protein [Gymnopilus junonius]|uniref:Single hybrid motif-containing protein n=1 Tax=Gymnopilus junonius TaxID=109634 RepID=A0A9P5N7K1_GYMJU|nr:single hybrid motif-containing protein [Gymnopilus junonius]